MARAARQRPDLAAALIPETASTEPGETPFEASARLDRFARSLGAGAWFAALGEPATDAETRAAETYLGGLGLSGVTPCWAADLEEARRIVRDEGWHRGWAEAEQTAVDGLTDRLDRRLGKGSATNRLNRLMADAGTIAFGPAAAAAARFGIADQGLIRAMAGAATRACFEMALAAALDEPGHPFAEKYRLFAGGRWPLVAIGEAYYIL